MSQHAPPRPKMASPWRPPFFPARGQPCCGRGFPAVLVQCPEPDRDWLEQLGPAFQTLSGAGPVQLLPLGAEPGPGWAGAPAGSGTFVHLWIQVRVWAWPGGLCGTQGGIFGVPPPL